jgi:hypothetical protein
MVKLVALLTTFSAGIFLTHATEAYLTADKAYCISEQAPPPAGVDQVPPITPVGLNLRAALIFAPVVQGGVLADIARNCRLAVLVSAGSNDH